MATAQVLDGGLLTVAQVAEITSLSRSSIYELMADGTLPYRTIFKLRRIPRRAVMAYLEAEFDCSEEGDGDAA